VENSRRNSVGFPGTPVSENQSIHQWHRKLFKTGRGYLSNWDTLVWRKITFLLSDSKNWEASAP